MGNIKKKKKESLKIISVINKPLKVVIYSSLSFVVEESKASKDI